MSHQFPAVVCHLPPALLLPLPLLYDLLCIVDCERQSQAHAEFFLSYEGESVSILNCTLMKFSFCLRLFYWELQKNYSFGGFRGGLWCTKFFFELLRSELRGAKKKVRKNLNFMGWLINNELPFKISKFIWEKALWSFSCPHRRKRPLLQNLYRPSLWVEWDIQSSFTCDSVYSAPIKWKRKSFALCFPNMALLMSPLSGQLLQNLSSSLLLWKMDAISVLLLWSIIFFITRKQELCFELWIKSKLWSWWVMKLY